MKLIPITDEKRLKEAGLPWSKNYIFKLRHYGTYPKLILRVGRRLMIDLDEFHRMVEEDIRLQTAKKKKIDEVKSHD